MPLGINEEEKNTPVPGYCSSSSGALGTVAGNEGSSWAASTEEIGGNRLIFHVTTVEPERISWRAYGFQLRCLSE